MGNKLIVYIWNSYIWNEDKLFIKMKWQLLIKIV